MPALRQNVMISLWRIRQRLAKLDLLVENGLGKNTLKICSFYQKHSKIEKSSSCVKQKGRLGKIVLVFCRYSSRFVWKIFTKNSGICKTGDLAGQYSITSIAKHAGADIWASMPCNRFFPIVVFFMIQALGCQSMKSQNLSSEMHPTWEKPSEENALSKPGWFQKFKDSLPWNRAKKPISDSTVALIVQYMNQNEMARCAS